jgi:hypothetical protein
MFYLCYLDYLGYIYFSYCFIALLYFIFIFIEHKFMFIFFIFAVLLANMVVLAAIYDDCAKIILYDFVSYQCRCVIFIGKFTISLIIILNLQLKKNWENASS